METKKVHISMSLSTESQRKLFSSKMMLSWMITTHMIMPDGTDETEFAEIDFIALSQDSSISNCRSVIDRFNDKEFDGIEGFCAIEKNESKLVLKRYKNPGYHSQADIAKDKQFLRNKVCSISNFNFNIEVLYETSSGFAERHVFSKNNC